MCNKIPTFQTGKLHYSDGNSVYMMASLFSKVSSVITTYGKVPSLLNVKAMVQLDLTGTHAKCIWHRLREMLHAFLTMHIHNNNAA